MKEFLNDDFLKKHLIKNHLERKFETSYTAETGKEGVLCQFCDKSFNYTKNLYVHIGIDHGKLAELVSDYNQSDDKESELKCRHCDFQGSLLGLKTHYVTTHHRQALESICLEEQLTTSFELICKYCQVC